MCFFSAYSQIDSAKISAAKLVIYAVIAMAWFVSPFLTLFVLLGLFFKVKLTEKEITFFYLLISLSFALLAYTNESTAEMSGGITTDIVRYYKSVSPYVHLNLSEALNLSFTFVEIEPVYVIVSACVVSLTGDVQMISFFWIFTVYFLYFLSLKNYMRYRSISLSSHQLFCLVFISLFGFILFTQATEILRQVVATSVFMYGFTLLLQNKKKGYIYIFLSLGVHVSVIFLLFLLLYKKITKNGFLIFFIVSLFLAIYNVMEFASILLPDVGYLGGLREKALAYTEELGGFHNSKRYLILSCLYFLMVLYVQYKIKPPSAILKTGYLYLLILLMNYSVPHNFIRFVNMSHFFYAIFFIEMLNDTHIKRPFRLCFLTGVAFLFLSLNFTMTRGRTLGKGYTSAYMNNSINDILFSSVPAFFEQKHYSQE